MRIMLASWPFWAVLSAVFAALTAIFGTIGVEAVNSDFATLIRTVIILIVLAVFVVATNAWQPLDSVPRKTWLFLVLSGVATGASWLCYFRALKLGDASRVAPIDKLSVVVAMGLAVVFLGETLAWKHWLGGLLIVSGTLILAYA